MHGYCPLCYKGKIGISGTIFVEESDDCLDKDQVMLSRRGNGLPVLNLESPGERCESSVMCKILCLVCGGSMLDGDEPDFESLIEVLDQLESMQLEFEGEVANCGLDFLAKSMEKDMRKKSHRALREYGLVWIEQWKKPVHHGCFQTAPCECLVPKFAEQCAKHGRRILKRTPVSRPEKEKTRGRQESGGRAPESTRTPIEPANSFITGTHMAPSGAGSGIEARSTSRATWLAPPSKMAITESHVPTDPSTSHSQVLSRRKAAGPPLKTAASLSSNTKKPHAHTMHGKMLKAASTCRKLDGWVGSKQNTHDSTSHASASSSSSAGAASNAGTYDLHRHNSTYDPFVHGPFRKDGQYWFLRPDGKAVRAQEGVCEFTKEGDLVPC